MTSKDRINRLRVAPPTLEPDPVLLGRLAALSAASTPAPHTARTAVVRLVAVASTVAVIGATTWVAGALPGIDSPVGPADQPTQGPTVPSIDASVTPQTDASSASGSPSSPGLPDATNENTGSVAPRFGNQPPGRSGEHRQDGDRGHRGNGEAKGHHKDNADRRHTDTAPSGPGRPGDDTGEGDWPGNGHEEWPGHLGHGHDGHAGHGHGHDDGHPGRGHAQDDGHPGRGHGHEDGHPGRGHDRDRGGSRRG